MGKFLFKRKEFSHRLFKNFLAFPEQKLIGGLPKDWYVEARTKTTLVLHDKLCVMQSD